jgi:hypothetical protein
MKLAQLVPGGRLTLSLIIWRGGCVVFSEILENFGHP